MFLCAGRFQAERVEQLRHSELMDDYMDPRQIWTTRDVAMRVHSGFRSAHVTQRFHWWTRCLSNHHPWRVCAGWSVCSLTASWLDTLCGTSSLCTCWRATSWPRCPTCCSSTTHWPTPLSLCSTCCWPSARCLRSTGLCVCVCVMCTVSQISGFRTDVVLIKFSHSLSVDLTWNDIFKFCFTPM